MLVLLFAGCGRLPFRNPFAARVGLRFLSQKQITEKLGTRALPEERDAFVEQWVNDEVWFRAAKKSVRPDPAMRSQIRDYRRQLIIRGYCENELRASGIIGENAVLDYYKKHADSFRIPTDAVFVELYACPHSETAKEIYNTLKSGERPALPPELLLIRSGDCAPVFEKALFDKRVNGLIEPLSVRNHYYVLSVIEYFPKNSPLRVEHVREEIIQKLQIEAQIQRYQEQQKVLKERFNVKIY